MKYENGKDILPEHLLKELQNYVSGKLIYIPAKETKKHWGEASGYRRLLIDRNKNIRTKFNNGISIDSLSNEFCLYIDSIKKIVYSKNKATCLSNIPQTSTNEAVDRKIFAKNERFSLGEYIIEVDSPLHYECWLDEETQDGYNYKVDFTYEEFITTPEHLRLEAVAIRNCDSTIINCGFEPHLDTDSREVHYLNGTSIIQKDFVKYRYE